MTLPAMPRNWGKKWAENERNLSFLKKETGVRDRRAQ